MAMAVSMEDMEDMAMAAMVMDTVAISTARGALMLMPRLIPTTMEDTAMAAMEDMAMEAMAMDTVDTSTASRRLRLISSPKTSMTFCLCPGLGNSSYSSPSQTLVCLYKTKLESVYWNVEASPYTV